MLISMVSKPILIVVVDIDVVFVINILGPKKIWLEKIHVQKKLLAKEIWIKKC